MKKAFVLTLSALVMLSSCDKHSEGPNVGARIIQPWNAVWTIKDIRATLQRIYPELAVPIFVEDGPILLAIVEDFENERCMLVRAQGWSGSMEVVVDGVRKDLEFEEEEIEVYGVVFDSDGPKEDREQTSFEYLGGWFALREDQTLDFVAILNGPSNNIVSLSYSPDQGWAGTIERSGEQ